MIPEFTNVWFTKFDEMLADFLYYFTSFVESEVKSNEVYTWNTDLKVVVLATSVVSPGIMLM